MKSKLLIVGLVLAALGAGFVFRAKDTLAENDNPYLELYRLRVSQAELNVTRREAMQELAASKFERAQRLIASSAMSREEYETLQAELRAADAETSLSKQKVDEAKAYLKIVEGLVARGVTIPLCTYEME